MSDPTSPRSVFESLLQRFSDGKWTDLADFYAEDAVVELPFAPPSPTRLQGREAVRAHFAAAAGLPLKIRASNVVVHDTGDPEVVIAEFDYDGQVTTTGHPLRVSNIQVLRVRNGQIVSSRDYHNHLAIAAALGQLPEPLSPLAHQGPA